MKYFYFLILVLFLNSCAFFAGDEKKDPVTVIPFSVEGWKYKINGQINDLDNAKTIVIFFHGSGVHDRWSTMPADLTYTGQPEAIFKPIVNELNKQGVATCVFDKRGFAELGKPEYADVEKTLNFDNIKRDARAVVDYVQGIEKYQNIVLIGHSEGTVTASEIVLDLKNKPNKITGLILMGVLAQNLKESLRYQLTDAISYNTFKMADPNKDGKIYPQEIPEKLKQGLPLAVIDKEKKGYIVAKDLSKILNAQIDFFYDEIENATNQTIISGKPAKWYRDFFNRKTLLERAREFYVPTLLIHGELDQNVTYKQNAEALFKKMRFVGRQVVLKSYPNYGHVLSPERDGLPTLGPIQPEVVSTIVKFVGWSM